MNCPECKREFVNKLCPDCGAMVRHVLMYEHLRRNWRLNNVNVVLHFAPEKIIKSYLRKQPNCRYLSADLIKGRAMQEMDIQEIHFSDGFFDLIIASHVMEHIEDDHKSLKELYRVLRPVGKALIVVPIECDNTIENPDELIDPNGHRRKCGLDYKERIESAGFKVDMYIFNDRKEAMFIAIK